MTYKRPKIIVSSAKDYKVSITERVILGKMRNKISLFDVELTYIPLSIVAKSERYEDPLDMFKSEHLSTMLERAHLEIKREFRRLTENRLEIDTDDICEEYHELKEKDKSFNVYFYDYMWERLLEQMTEVKHEKMMEDFVTRDKILDLASLMKENFNQGKITKECYQIFKSYLVKLELIESDEHKDV